MRALMGWCAAAVLVGFFAPGFALAGTAAFCAAGVTDDALRPVPQSLARQAGAAFGLRGGPADGTVVRCMNGRVLACNYGANLPCGLANTDTEMPRAESWCKARPDASFIPAYVTGHNSIFQWRCQHGAPVHIGRAEPIDARGFIARYWKALPQ